MMVSKKIGSLTFVGVGLYRTDDLTIQAVNSTTKADVVFFDTYTSLITGATLEEFSAKFARTIIPLSREDIEDRPEKGILKSAKKENVVLLVPGDPMVSTTHIDLRLRAHRLGIQTSIIHGVSIHSAALSACGLENYKAGASITLPFTTEKYTPKSPYIRLAENYQRGLHTLIYLDIQADKNRFMTVPEGIRALLLLEDRIQKGLITPRSILVGLARVGSPDMQITAANPDKLQKVSWGPPPHIIIFPGRLHFMEAESLVEFANAPRTILSEHIKKH
ncbi:MAG: diphthine synthase [Candidatus Ranarchaeia archaeon]